MPHKISLDDAERLIHGFLYLSPFEPVKNNLPIGGHLFIRNIEGRPTTGLDADYAVRGTRSWYMCPGNGNLFAMENPDFITVAFETAYIRDTYHPEREPKSNELYTCKQESLIFMEPAKSVSQFLREFSGSLPTELIVTGNDADVFAANFAKNYSCNNTSVAFFINDDDEYAVNEFIQNSGIKSVRFFYGYDLKMEKDNIRLILIAVNDDMKNIIDENAVILDKSWPPR